MLFTTNLFVFYFLPGVLLCYYGIGVLIHGRAWKLAVQNGILLITSIFFYYYGSGKMVLLLIAVIVINYIFALLIENSRSRPNVIKWLLIICTVGNIGLLLYFKYTHFIYSLIAKGLEKIAYTPPQIAEIILPIGVSFYIFQAVSYTIDVYRQTVCAQKNPFKLALYIGFFPQLIAGPIVRYETVHCAIESRKSTVNDFYEGLCRFGFGLGKKVIIADTFNSITSQISTLNINEVSVAMAWIGIISYTLQIYFDFSGYSDMAIGMAKMFGFRFNENFSLPYISQSMTEFWRRWHISLSTWFRDYLYIPLGGNRVSSYRVYVNLGIVFMLCGLWHGANLTFLAWGIYHGLYLIFERIIGNRYRNLISGAIGRVYAIFVVAMGWVLFMSRDLEYAITFYTRSLSENFFFPD